MLTILLKLLNINKTCSHEKVLPHQDYAYCPDCGKFIQNEWFITRCACCGVKLKARVKNGAIITQEHFCTNCGSEDFIVEKLEKIDFINVNYATLIKKEVDSHKKAITRQYWQEKNNEPQKLLIQYL